MDLLLRDRIAVIGGASQGIGYGIARALAAEGAKIAIMARRAADLQDAADRIRSETGAAVLAVPADCRRAGGCTRAIATVCEAYGSLAVVRHHDGGPPRARIAAIARSAGGP